MLNIIKKLWILLLFLSLTACGTTWFSNPATNPVIEDKVGKWREEPVGTLAVTADRRIIIVRLEPDAKFCAEPPPDVAENLTNQLNLAVKAQVEGQGGEFTLKDQLTKQIEALIQRTQGVDIYRTGMYDICQHFLNDAISGENVMQLSSELLQVSKELILEEIRLKYGSVQKGVFTKSGSDTTP